MTGRKDDDSKPAIQADEVEAGLKAVFSANASVLARLAPDGVMASPPLLKDAAEGGDTPMLSPARGREGRYQVTGEVARGGVGVVLRGHDVDLGRDVAMKVIREEYAGNEEVLQRFVEEAQIGGQLQHPGVVPVYEMGLGSDGRPFFTMKLVKGDTLAARLKDRTGARRGTRKMLRIFEGVCQTMAYAHARGVIHRDLKPANVMVGAFGEVLVVDWGMGKVLRRGEDKPSEHTEIDKSIIATFRSAGSGTDSIVGSVMGTPQYMAPEQARGDIDAVDERSDVFALGAILCEILTGEPPYEGKGREALMAAGKADLAGALARLDACDVEEDLVAICTQCLSPSPGVRPQDAGQLASAVSAYLAGVEQRAQAAVLEAAAAQVQAEEEGRRRRVTRALAGAVVCLVLVVGGGLFWMQSAAAARDQETAALVRADLEAVVRLQGEAEGRGDPAAFGKAFDALARVESVLAARDAGAQLMTRVADRRAALEAGRAAVTARQVAQQKDAAFVRAVEELSAEALGERDAEEVMRAFLALLAERGIDPRSDSDEQIRAAIEASPVREALWRALAGAAECESVAADQSGGTVRERRLRQAAREPVPLMKLARRLEQDPWRRASNEAKDYASWKAHALAPGLLDRDARDIVAVSASLELNGDGAEARALLASAVRRRPADFNLNLAAAMNAGFSGTPDYVKATRYAAAAVALRPDSVVARIHLASLLPAQGRSDEAVRLLEAVVRDAPAGHLRDQGRGMLAGTYVRMGRGEEAEALGRALVRDRPDWASSHAGLGSVLVVLGRHADALPVLERAAQLDPFSAHNWCMISTTHEMLGDLPKAEAALQRALKIEPDHWLALGGLARVAAQRHDMDEAIRLGRKALSGPSADTRISTRLDLAKALHVVGRVAECEVEVDRVLKLIERMPYKQAVRAQWAHAHLIKGACRMERGDPGAAERFTRKGLELGTPGDPLGQLQLANVLRAQGRHEEAIEVARAMVGAMENFGAAHVAGAEAMLGVALQAAGRHGEALESFERAIRIDPKVPSAYINAYGSYVATRDLVRALAAAEEGARRAPQEAHALTNHASALMVVFRTAEALEVAQRASKLRGDHWQSRSTQVLALARLGRLEEAQNALVDFKRFLAGLPEATRAEARRAVPMLEVRIADGRKLEGFRKKTWSPATVQDVALLAVTASGQGDHALAAPLWQDAFRMSGISGAPYWVDARYTAARSAVLAGKPGVALPWLRKDVDLAMARAQSGAPYALREAQGRARLLRWLPAFQSVRDAEALAKLSADARKAWTKLWKDVDALLAK